MKKSNKLFIASILFVLIIFIVIFSFKYLKQQKKEVITYQGFTFEKSGGMWFTEWVRQDKQRFIMPFNYNPKEVEDVVIDGRLSDSFAKDPQIYLTFDPDEMNFNYVAVAFTELSFNLLQVFGITPVAACTRNVTACASRPLVTCDDMDKSVIYVKQANATRVILAGNCVIIEGSGPDIVRATERLLFGMYNIMKRE